MNKFLDVGGNTKICHDWGSWNRDFYECAEDKLKAALAQEGFACYSVWWRKYFPNGTRECSYDRDFDEIVRQG